MRLLLDSHAVLWALYDPEKLSQRVKELVEEPSNRLIVSHVTILELANKAAAGRLPLIGPFPDRMVERIDRLGAVFLAITLEDILTAAGLPKHHADPLDRILIAQAQGNDLCLVTKDADIPKYDVKTIWM